MSRRATFVANHSSSNVRAFSPLHLKGIQPVARTFPKSIYFDGTSRLAAEVPAAQAAIVAQEFTITMWMKRDTHGEERQTLFWGGGASPPQRLEFDVYGHGTLGVNGYAGSLPSIEVDTWHFVAMVKRNNDTIRLFIDGVWTASQPTQTVQCGTAGIFVGRNWEFQNSYKGYVAHIAYFETALTNPAIATLYNEGTPLDDLQTNQGDYTEAESLLAWWKFEDTLEDATGNGYAWTPSGDPQFSEDMPGSE
jgi:hypothetical protein